MPRKESLLNHHTKGELADRVIVAEHNLEAMKETFEIQYSNCLKMVEDMSLLNENLKQIRKY